MTVVSTAERSPGSWWTVDAARLAGREFEAELGGDHDPVTYRFERLANVRRGTLRTTTTR